MAGRGHRAGVGMPGAVVVALAVVWTWNTANSATTTPAPNMTTTAPNMTTAAPNMTTTAPNMTTTTTPPPIPCGDTPCVYRPCVDISCVDEACVFTHAFSGEECDDQNDLTVDDVCIEGDCKGECSTQLKEDNVCVSNCSQGKAPDLHLGACADLHPECGDNCLECAGDGQSCARCTFDTFLDAGVCASECRAKTGSGENDFTTVTSPAGRYCAEYVDPACAEPSTCPARECNTVVCSGFPAECTYTSIADDTVCNDGRSNTADDKCTAGVCLGKCVGRLYQNGDQCVSKCPTDKVLDFKTCVDEQCGVSNCIGCNGQNLCTRCIPTLKLQNGRCVTTCSAKDTNGDEDFTTSGQGYKTCAASSTESTGSSGGLGSTAILVIAAAGGAVGLVILCICVYVCYERRRTEAFDLTQVSTEAKPREKVYRPAASGRSMEMGSNGASASAAPGRTLNFGTSGTEESNVDDFDERGRLENKSAGAVGAEAAEAAEPEALSLDEERTRAFFSRLGQLKKDKTTFASILQEMKRRRDSKRDASGRQKYQKVVDDLTRLLKLFKQKKSDRTVPADGPQLLIWAQQTLDRYLGQQAKLAFANPAL